MKRVTKKDLVASVENVDSSGKIFLDNQQKNMPELSTSFSKQQYNAVVSTINRYVWCREPVVQQCRTNAKASWGKYKCAACNNLFGPKEIQVDHIHPRVPATEDNIKTLTQYTERCFVSIESLQVLCNPCHNYKTYVERQK
jgi:5-methylcytosine-specific restriction endonuclease McrA